MASSCQLSAVRIQFARSRPFLGLLDIGSAFSVFLEFHQRGKVVFWGFETKEQQEGGGDVSQARLGQRSTAGKEQARWILQDRPVRRELRPGWS